MNLFPSHVTGLTRGPLHDREDERQGHPAKERRHCGCRQRLAITTAISQDVAIRRPRFRRLPFRRSRYGRKRRLLGCLDSANFRIRYTLERVNHSALLAQPMPVARESFVACGRAELALREGRRSRRRDRDRRRSTRSPTYKFRSFFLYSFYFPFFSFVFSIFPIPIIILIGNFSFPIIIVLFNFFFSFFFFILNIPNGRAAGLREVESAVEAG